MTSPVNVGPIIPPSSNTIEKQTNPAMQPALPPVLMRHWSQANPALKSTVDSALSTLYCILEADSGSEALFFLLCLHFVLFFLSCWAASSSLRKPPGLRCLTLSHQVSARHPLQGNTVSMSNKLSTDTYVDERIYYGWYAYTFDEIKPIIYCCCCSCRFFPRNDSLRDQCDVGRK